MRIAVASDIHGNPIALDAILQDIADCGGVDEYWVLGDIVALGHDPVGILERLAGLPNVQCVRGNTERYVCTGDRPPPTLEQARADPEMLPTLVEVAGTFSWTQGAITQAGWLEWLSDLPVEFHTTLPDGSRVLCAHAGPGRDDGIGFQPGQSAADHRILLGECEADLVFAGHSHEPVDTLVGNTRVVNVGCVSNPVPPDLRACYVMVEANSEGYSLEHRRVEYDRQRAIDALERLHHPGRRFIREMLRGHIRPPVYRPSEKPSAPQEDSSCSGS